MNEQRDPPRPPLPPFDRESAARKVRMAEDAWNTRDPGRVALAYTADSRWRNRSQFLRGQVDKYTWTDVGSSYLPGEIIAAFLWAQMEEADAITRRRLAMWGTYHQWFAEAERAGSLRRPVVPGHCVHNAHMYYLLLPDLPANRYAEISVEVREICERYGITYNTGPLRKQFGSVVRKI